MLARYAHAIRTAGRYDPDLADAAPLPAVTRFLAGLLPGEEPTDEALVWLHRFADYQHGTAQLGPSSTPTGVCPAELREVNEIARKATTTRRRLPRTLAAVAVAAAAALSAVSLSAAPASAFIRWDWVYYCWSATYQTPGGGTAGCQWVWIQR